jgi:hypothetical protein
MEVTDENIKNQLLDYMDDYREYQTILKDIRDYRKKFAKRIDFLKNSMTTKGNKIITYIDENNHPAVKFQNVYFTPQQGIQRTSQKSKKKQVENIFEKYNIPKTSPLYVEISTTIHGKKQCDEKKLKVKTTL